MQAMCSANGVSVHRMFLVIRGSSGTLPRMTQWGSDRTPVQTVSLRLGSRQLCYRKEKPFLWQISNPACIVVPACLLPSFLADVALLWAARDVSARNGVILDRLQMS